MLASLLHCIHQGCCQGGHHPVHMLSSSVATSTSKSEVDGLEEADSLAHIKKPRKRGGTGNRGIKYLEYQR